MKGTSQRNYKCALKSYFHTVFGKFHMDFAKIKIDRRQYKSQKDILTKDEWERLKEALPERFRIMYQILLGSGLRI